MGNRRSRCLSLLETDISYSMYGRKVTQLANYGIFGLYIFSIGIDSVLGFRIASLMHYAGELSSQFSKQVVKFHLNIHGFLILTTLCCSYTLNSEICLLKL